MYDDQSDMTRLNEQDVLYTLSFRPQENVRHRFAFHAFELNGVLELARRFMRKYDIVDSAALRTDGINLTELLGSLGNLCKGSVILSLDPQKGIIPFVKKRRTSTRIAKNYLADLERTSPEIFEDGAEGPFGISPAQRQAMIELNRFLHIRYYPTSHFAYYDMYDTDLAELLEQAIQGVQDAANNPDARMVESTVAEWLGGLANVDKQEDISHG